MGSVRLVYDAERDILDVDFRLTGEKPRRGIELHDNVTVWTDAEENKILRLMLISYAQLCTQPTLVFNSLQKLPLRTEARRLWSEARDLFARVGVAPRQKLGQQWLDELPPS